MYMQFEQVMVLPLMVSPSLFERYMPHPNWEMLRFLTVMLF